MSYRRETGKSSRLVIFLRWFSVSTAIIYLPIMWLLKLSPSFDEPYFTGWFFVGWLGLCGFYTLFMWVWMRAWFNNMFINRAEHWQWRRNGGDPYFDWLPWPANPDAWVNRMAIGTPPDFDCCPNCNNNVPLGQYFGNQCGNCGLFFDNFYANPPLEDHRQFE